MTHKKRVRISILLSLSQSLKLSSITKPSIFASTIFPGLPPSQLIVHQRCWDTPIIARLVIPGRGNFGATIRGQQPTALHPLLLPRSRPRRAILAQYTAQRAPQTGGIPIKETFRIMERIRKCPKMEVLDNLCLFSFFFRLISGTDVLIPVNLE